ncbi:MAG: FAD-binding oxidoreductase [Candidatus Omnitrophota bacterium]|nr:MAG: FAD-binding oxidoreductase [Candidatus Omnitrophota bacterium]
MITKQKREEFSSYLEDTSNLKGTASSLYLPQERNEIISMIREWGEKKIPYTISSGRTGTTGGCVPLAGVVISLENLKKIIDIDKEKRTVSLEAGVSLEELEREANKFNLTLRASPTESLAFVGGAISTCASGVRGFGYGSIRNYIKECEVVLPTADTFTLKRGGITSKKRVFDFEQKSKKYQFSLPAYTMPRVKSQAGYFVADNIDLIDLFCGAEGTLGIVTSCTLMLQQIPPHAFDGLVFFKNENDALEFVAEIRALTKNTSLGATSLEFFDVRSLEMLKEKFSFIPSSATAAVYFEQEAKDQKRYNTLLEQWAQLIEKNNASLDESIIAETPKEREKVFDFRHTLPQMINEFLRQHNQIKAATDIAVPWEHFREMYTFYKGKGGESKIHFVNFGHIGESHLHFNFLPKNEEQGLLARKYLTLFCQKATSLGGTVSAEHGIGKIKKPYLKIMYTEKDINEMMLLKKYFDPHCLLGLDNIFGKDILLKTG